MNRFITALALAALAGGFLPAEEAKPCCKDKAACSQACKDKKKDAKACPECKDAKACAHHGKEKPKA